MTAPTSSGGGADPADLPTGEREGLAPGADRDRAVAHARQCRERDVFAVVDEMLVDLVGDDDEIVFLRDLGDERQLLAAEDLARRVVGRVEQQQLGARRDRGAQLRRVERVVGRAQRDDAPLCARHRDARRVRVVVRLEGDDLVARTAQRDQRSRDRLGRARGDEDLGIGVVVEPVEAPLVRADRVAQLGHADARRILVVARFDRVDRGLLDDFGTVGVGKALPEIDRARRHRERRHLREDRRPERLQPLDQIRIHAPDPRSPVEPTHMSRMRSHPGGGGARIQCCSGTALPIRSASAWSRFSGPSCDL